MNRIREIEKHGQSVWFDYIQRSMIWTGGLYSMMEADGLKGVTSNPAIFEKAISGSKDYRAALKALVEGGASPLEAFEQLAITDITLACDVLRKVYDETEGRDGFVSLEVSPHLAYDTPGTVEEGLRLWELVSRDNLMIKVPGTEEGLPAIKELIGAGVNVNVTLLFSVERYEEVFKAYAEGLELLVARGGDPSKVASVASFFISRIDSLVDKTIDERISGSSDEAQKKKLEAIKGEVAIANAKVAYASYERMVQEDSWKKLAAKGAQAQRLLWASTSTKNAAYRDVRYIEELIGPDTVNTVPEKTYKAFMDHGEPAAKLKTELDAAKTTMATLAEVDISMKALTDQLVDQGVVLFQEAFDRLIGTVAQRREELLGGHLSQMKIDAPEYREAIDARLTSLDDASFVRRMWMRDGSLWSSDEDEQEMISSFMGWLDIVDEMHGAIEELQELQDDIDDTGHTHVVVMGMGGSSLAPDVLAKTFGQLPGSPELVVLDSTVPSQVKAVEAQIELDNSTYIVASKSGTTSEPLAFDSYFFEKSGGDGKRFIAITDPESHLDELASERGSSVYCGVPEIGGRYSALSPFGMVPAAAMGLDVFDLLQRARVMVGSCEESVPATANPGVQLGVALGEMALAGRDKLTIVASPKIAAFGGWLEQLVAESTGKIGKGIVPVDGEALGAPEVYGSDRCFAYLKWAGDDAEAIAAQEKALAALSKAGHPVIAFELSDRRDLVQEMFRWEIATATAAHVMQLNPFDQPNVQESKDNTKALLKASAESGERPEAPGQVKLLEADGVTLYADEKNAPALQGGDLKSVIAAHLGRVTERDYVAFNAYVEMNEANDALLQQMRNHVRGARKVATTVGYGPRFLHSTGQLHKGGANTGVFLQITSEDGQDLEVPGLGHSFGVLKAAQQAGDFMALASRERRLLRVHLGADVQAGLQALLSALQA